MEGRREAESRSRVSEQEKHIDRFAEANQLIRGRVRSTDDAWKQKQLCQNRTRPEMNTAQSKKEEENEGKRRKAENVRMPGQEMR